MRSDTALHIRALRIASEAIPATFTPNPTLLPMNPLIGLSLSGASLTPFNDLAVGEGALGRPVWGPEQLLGDIELRLGLESPGVSRALRIMSWAARMDQLCDGGAFYARSFERNPFTIGPLSG